MHADKLRQTEAYEPTYGHIAPPSTAQSRHPLPPEPDLRSISAEVSQCQSTRKHQLWHNRTSNVDRRKPEALSFNKASAGAFP